ncbi:SusE domain-containing protein [Echinicola marina]|uniref:SusE domain-containing protein n=1 Tax=Echinicola marina TaxID=2859768 RepID=UPI001CF6FA38|nr:SusE domain-containing protein [Echinicola marina]UCS91804.1 SusE domain-containing protein [Echinicola marina]
MKNISYQFLSLIMVLMAVWSCQEDTELHTEVSPVQTLYAPENNAYMNLGAQSSAIFEWEAAKAADNGVVLYDVVFDEEGGDFSEPLFVMPSDGRGMQRTLTLPFSELNRIAEMAGIQPEGVGKLQWSVQSSKGINVQEILDIRTIEVERPAGFPAPDELYLTGSATEAGEDLSNAILMKKTSANTFEAYTSLKAGSYFFAERNSGEPGTYYIEGEKLKAEGETAYSGEEKVYRIRVDFSNGTTEIHEIGDVELWFAPNGEFLTGLPYTSNGIWAVDDFPIEFRQESWGRDERYKFRFMVTDAEGNTSEEWFGSTNGDNQRPNESTGPAYWYMVPVTNDRWNNCFKFATEVDNASADIQIMFNAEVSNYTHSVTVE